MQWVVMLLAVTSLCSCQRQQPPRPSANSNSATDANSATNPETQVPGETHGNTETHGDTETHGAPPASPDVAAEGTSPRPASFADESAGREPGFGSQNTPADGFPREFAEQIRAIQDGERQQLITRYSVVTDQQLRLLAGNEHLRDLLIDNGQITDEAADWLGTWPNLEHLRLRLSPLRGAGLRAIAALPQLRFLNLPHAELQDGDLACLQQLTQLELLRIGSPHLTDEGIADLAEHPSLRFLHFIQIPLTDQSLQSLATLPALESLYLDGAEISDAGWQWWFDQRPDVHVHLDQLHHDLDPNRH